MTATQPLKWLSRQKQQVIENTNFDIEVVSTIKKTGNIKIHMFSRNSMYPLPRDGVISAHINGDHVSMYKSWIGTSWIGEKILLWHHA